MNFLPHGFCFAWAPNLLWSMVAADSLIAAAYFSIPLAIVTVVRRRGETSFGWMPWLFSGFIFACGITHVLDVWTIWDPYYRTQVLAKVVTAAVSVLTAVALWRLIPRVLAIPSVSQLQTAIRSLEAEARRRQLAENTLMDVRQSLALTLASIDAGFIATDRDGCVTHMNAVAERLTGWTESDARGRSFWDVFVRADRPAEFLQRNPVDLMIERRVTVETAHHVDVVNRSGGSCTVELKADVTYSKDGEARGLAMVFRDMSRLMRAEAEAKRLAAIVASSADAIIGVDLEGRIASWNEGARGMFGYGAAEVIGEPLDMLELERGGERAHEIDPASAAAPTFDSRGRAKDGSVREISVTASPIRDGDGRAVGESLIARDVSQQRRAEAALRDSEAKLRFVVEAARIGEWYVDLRSGLTRHSVLHAECFGYFGELPEWSLDRELEHVHPEERREVRGLWEKHTAAPGPWSFEFRAVWPDASVHWIAIHGSTVFEAGLPVSQLGITRDITEQKMAEESRVKSLRLEAENREIQEASRLKSLFLANMSHELRTPLNAIIGFSDLLYSGAVRPESPKHREFLGHIGTSGRHLLQLINDVLDLSKVESGKFEFYPEPVHLATLIADVKSVLYSAIQRKALTVAEDIDPSLAGTVKVDPARLKQALYNFLSNAIKFTGVAGHVTIRARPEGPHHFRIEVEDDGIGISAEDAPKLFNEFQQLDSGYSKQHQGTGLGLALTRRLIEAQGGRVGLRSVLGEGSVFHLVLNRTHGTDTAAQRSCA